MFCDGASLVAISGAASTAPNESQWYLGTSLAMNPVTRSRPGHQIQSSFGGICFAPDKLSCFCKHEQT